MSFDKMSFLTHTSTKGLSLTTNNKTNKGRFLSSILFSRSKLTKPTNNVNKDETPLTFLAVPYNTVDHAGRPYTDIPEPTYETVTSSSGSASTSVTTESCSEYQAISFDRYKPVTHLTSILVAPARGNSTRSVRRKQVRFDIPASERQGTSSYAPMTNNTSRTSTNVRGETIEYYTPASRRQGLRRPKQSAAQIAPPTPMDEENDDIKTWLPISPVSPTSPLPSITSTPTAFYANSEIGAPICLPVTTQRIPLKRSNASCDSTTSTSSSPFLTKPLSIRHSRHSMYAASAQAASIALCDKIRAARAGEVFAKRAINGRAEVKAQQQGTYHDETETAEVAGKTDKDAGSEGEYETFCEGWGRRG